MYKVIKIDKDAYKSILDNYNGHIVFTQSSHYGDVQEKEKNKYQYIKILKGDDVVSIALVYYAKFKRIFQKAYIIYGPVIIDNNIDYDNFFKDIKKYIFRNIRVISLEINPYIIKSKYTKDEIIEKDRNIKIHNSFIKNNFYHIEEDWFENQAIQGKKFYVKNIENMNLDDILKSFKTNIKRNIKSNLEKGILATKLTLDNIQDFKENLEFTYKKHNSNQKVNIKLYENIIKSFKDDAFLMGIKIEVEKLLQWHSNKNGELEKENERLIENTSKKDKNKNKIKQNNIQIAKNNRIIEFLNEKKSRGIKEYYSDIALFIITGKELIYFLDGAIKNTFSENIMLHYYMLEEAIKRNIKYYNLFLVSGIFSHENNPANDYGVYQYKTNFNGEILELLGTYRYNNFIAKILD